MNINEHASSTPANAPLSLMIVDDDANVLAGFRRSIGRKWNLVTAQGGPAAITLVKEKGPFAVIITDMQMPGMNGIEFLEAVRPLAKYSVLMMLTGNVDQATAAQAINRGHVFRFLNKPCTPETMDAAIAAGMRQYELITAERVLLRDTLAGSIRLLTDAMTLSRPTLAISTASVRANTHRIANKIGLSSDWRLPIAASLSLLGFAVMRELSDAAMFEEANLHECTKSGAKLLRRAPRKANLAVERRFGEWWIGADLHAAAPRPEFGGELAGYGVVGLSVRRPLSDAWSERLRIDNLLDRDYQLANGFNAPGNTALLQLSWQAR